LRDEDYKKLQSVMARLRDCERTVYTDKTKCLRLEMNQLLVSEPELLAEFEWLFRNAPQKTVEERAKEGSTDGSSSGTS
jgi:hypothetical protein